MKHRTDYADKHQTFCIFQVYCNHICWESETTNIITTFTQYIWSGKAGAELGEIKKKNNKNCTLGGKPSPSDQTHFHCKNSMK